MGRGHQRVHARLATRYGAFFLYALYRNPSIPRVRLMGFAIKTHLKMRFYWLYPSYEHYSFSLRTSEPMMLE